MAQTWDPANPDPTTFSAGDAPMVFNNVNGVAGCSMTVAFAGSYVPKNNDNLLDAAGFDNRTNNAGGPNTWTVSFSGVVDFRIEMTTHHGAIETNTLEIFWR